jgi:hypothetical protein
MSHLCQYEDSDFGKLVKIDQSVLQTGHEKIIFQGHSAQTPLQLCYLAASNFR